MHMADALVSPVVGGTMAVASAAAISYSIIKLKKEDNTKNFPLMGVMSAFVFAAQMINFTIPGTGSSGHLCGGALLSALLGPYAGFLSMVSILIIQCFLFADGGILALGCNIWNMAFYACFFGYFCIYKPIIDKKISTKRIIIASCLTSIISLQLGALSVTIETLLSGITELPFTVFLSFMQPIHLVIGLVEGLVTAGTLIFIYKMNPEILKSNNEISSKEGLKKLIGIMAIVVVIVAGGISLVASSNPDGLEWSIEKVTGETELEADNEIHSSFEEIQSKTSLLPDYNLKDQDSLIGTSFSGVIGASIVASIGVIAALGIRNFKK